MELKPTAKVAEALAIAQRAAQTAGHAEITPAHLVLALVEQNGGGQGQYGFGEKAQAQAPTRPVG